MAKVPETDVMRFFQRFNQGEFPYLRLGQAFVNEFQIDCNSNHDEYCLFHETDGGKAAKYIWENLVDSLSF